MYSSSRNCCCISCAGSPSIWFSHCSIRACVITSYSIHYTKLYEPLKAGNTFSDEPGIYIRGEFGVRLEDDMVITEAGAELFTPQSPSYNFV